MIEKNRRNFLKAGALFSLVAWMSKARAGDYGSKLSPTPTEIKGPFYPITAQKDKDFDLTQVEDSKETAKGTFIVIEGHVVDTDGAPVEDATVEIWQANAAGRYAHPHDSNTAPLDPHFQGWAIVPSGKDGGFRFKSVMPGSYPAAEGWDRPPHIHFKVAKKGYVELVTQMYFPGHPLNEKDNLILRKSPEQRAMMVAEKPRATEETYRYRIVIEKA
ncbi:MAG: protocatechuate 3,4-dioxygenase [Planctomycetota bacterium]